MIKNTPPHTGHNGSDIPDKDNIVLFKKTAVILAIYASCLFLSTVFFITLFHVDSIKLTNTFFYNGCVYLLVSSFLCSALMFLAKKIWPGVLRLNDVICIFFIFSGFTMGWFSLIPVTVERSISVYMLSYLDENYPQTITKDQFEKTFYQQYIHDFGAFDKRFREQLDTASIEFVPDDNSYRITDKGRKIVNLFRLFAHIFGTEKKLIYPNEYAGVKSNENNCTQVLKNNAELK